MKLDTPSVKQVLQIADSPFQANCSAFLIFLGGFHRRAVMMRTSEKPRRTSNNDCSLQCGTLWGQQ